MRRREFLAGLGSAAAWPVVARAQGERVRQIGVLLADENQPDYPKYAAALRQGLAQFGWIEGRNLRIDTRYGPQEQISDRAEALVSSTPEVIITFGGLATRATQQRTRSIPIVFVSVGDPVEIGILRNIARPEGNVTGFTNAFASFGSKWLELLKEVVPRISRAAIVWDPDSYQGSSFASIESTAKAMGIDPVKIPVRTAAEIALAIPSFAVQPNGGLLVMPGRLEALIVKLAIERKLPSVGSGREGAAAGTLLSYGSNRVDLFRDSAIYIDRILRGARAGDLPVQFPTRFELIVNLKTAKALGIEVPDKLLALADEVIE